MRSLSLDAAHTMSGQMSGLQELLRIFWYYLKKSEKKRKKKSEKKINFMVSRPTPRNVL